MRRLVTIAVLGAAFAAPGSALASPPGTGVVVDQPDGFTDPLTGAGHASDAAGAESVSADGRYVVFASEADGLAGNDDDRVTNVYRKDRRTGAVVLVSASTAGVAADGDSGDASISADGSTVAFTSEATNLGGTTNGDTHVYVRTFEDGATLLVSRADGASGEPVTAVTPSLGANGTSVAFVTPASLHPKDGNGKPDVYVRRLLSRTTLWASRISGANGGSGPADSVQPALDASGTRVAFTTASPLDSADPNGLRDVYRRNLATDLTEVVSVSEQTKTTLGGGSDSPAITPDGLGVAFRSDARGLDGDLQDGTGADVFVRHGGDVVLSSNLGQGATDSGQPDVAGDRDSLRVAFVSYLETEPGSGTRLGQVGIRNHATGTYEPASVSPDGSLGDGSSGDPSLVEGTDEVVFETAATNLGGGSGGDHDDVVARDYDGDTTSLVSSGASGPLAEDLDRVELGQGSAITPDGRYAIVVAGHDGLGVPGRRAHAFRRDLRTGTTVPVDRGADGKPAEDVLEAAISADGNRVAFVTTDALVPTDTNGGQDVYLRDIAAGTTTLVSRTAAGAAGNSASWNPVLDADGTRIAFTSQASNLSSFADENQRTDVFVADLETGRTELASRAVLASNGDSSRPAISADGRTVAFESNATNLAAEDKDPKADVYVKTLGDGVSFLALASVRSDGTHLNASSQYPTLSADGRRVAFLSHATLDAEDGDAAMDVYVREVATQRTMLASRETGPAGRKADAPSFGALISPDGRHVAFTSGATNLGGAAGDAYVRGLEDAKTVRVARGYPAGVTASGSCVVLLTRRHPVLRSSEDFSRLVLQAVTDGCEVTTGPPAGGTPRDGGTGSGSTNGGTTGGSGTGGDQGTTRKAPVLSGLALTRTRVSTRRGTVVRFRLDRRATVLLDVQRRVRGRWVSRGRLTHTGKAGGNRVAFKARIGRRAIPRGSYRLVARARDMRVKRLVSPARSVRFRVVR